MHIRLTVALAICLSAGGALAQSAGGKAPAGPPAVKPLRFVLTMGMRNLPNDRNNSMCYSNVITRPAPPGWGAPGFLPTGSAEQARKAIYDLKDEFIAKCRASGREITSEGNFGFHMNQYKDDDRRVDNTAPRVPEDVKVQMD